MRPPLLNATRSAGYSSLMRARTLIAFACVAPTLASSQGVRVLDKGTFTITVNGTRAGREDFTISSTPGGNGAEYLSHARVSMGDRRLNPKLMTDSSGRPSRYEIDVRGTAGGERWMGSIVRGRVAAKMETASGIREREYLATDGALLLDDEVYHQYYFVMQRLDRGTIPVVIPRRNVQMVLRASAPTADKVTIGQVTLDARRVVLTEPGGVTREVWTDATGRLLKVTIPSMGIVALRDDPPGS
jgi:hypothetical protein